MQVFGLLHKVESGKQKKEKGTNEGSLTVYGIIS